MFLFRQCPQHIDPDIKLWMYNLALDLNLAIANIKSWFEGMGLKAQRWRIDTSEGLEVSVDLVKEVLNNHGAMLGSIRVPSIKARRRMSASPLSVLFRGIIDIYRFFLGHSDIFFPRIVNQLINRVLSTSTATIPGTEILSGIS
jgi:hypothetical protein